MSLLSTVTFAQADPWQPYADHGNGQGQGKTGGVVPESGTYGLIMMGVCLVLMLAARIDRPRR